MNRAERRRRGVRGMAVTPMRALSIGALISSGLVGGYLGTRAGTAYAAPTTCSSVVGAIATDDSFIAALGAVAAGTCEFIDISGNISFSGRGLLDDTLTLTSDDTVFIGSAVDDSTVTLDGNGTPGLFIETTATYDLKLYVSDVTFTDFDDSGSNHAALSIDVGGELEARLDTVGFVANTSTWNGVSLNYQTAALSAYAANSALVYVLGDSEFAQNTVGPFGTPAVRTWNSTGNSHLYLGDPFDPQQQSTISLDSNQADWAVVWADYLTMSGVRVTNHSGPGDTILAEKYLGVVDSYFAENRGGISGGGSGGVFRALSGGYVGGSYFKNNYSGDVGGAIDSGSAHLYVKNSRFVDDSSSGDGGAISAGSVRIVDSVFEGNASGRYGGALRADDTVQVVNSTFTGNEALGGQGFGGAIYTPGDVVISGGMFVRNQTYHLGGAVYSRSDVRIEDGRFEANSAGSGGGAVISGDQLMVARSVFKGNSATNYGLGGAIFASANTVISQVTFDGNSATDSGGAIYTTGELLINNSTFYRNSAADFGGDINANGLPVVLNYVTSVDGAAPNGVVSSFGGTLTLTGSVIAPNLGADACTNLADDSSVASLVTDSTCGAGDDTVSVVSRAALAFDSPLTTSDVPGRQVLIPGSRSLLANGAPNRAGVAADQLGQLRGAPTSIGSVLVPPPPPPPPPQPATAPRDVIGVAGDASAEISWRPSESSGSFPVTTYQVQASPGGAGCMSVITSCEVSGLTNGTSYTFIVRALTGAGWSAWSAASAPVVPQPPPRPSATITITGSRQEREVVVRGETTELVGSAVQARVRLPGQTRYQPGSSRQVDAEGGFTWQRTSGKKTYVYFVAEDGAVRSNRVVIPAR